MSDLRNRIKENKELFNNQKLPEGHGERFKARLGRRESALNYNWLKVAAAIFILIASGALVWEYHSSEINSSVETVADLQIESAMDTELPLKEASKYYEQTLNKQFVALEDFYGDDDSKLLIEETKELIAKLRVDYKALEKELESTGDERVVMAMIQNYQKRIGLLEELMQKLIYIKQLKQTYHEKSNQDA